MELLDIALNDLRRSYRSFSAVGMMVVMPIMLTGLIYLAFSGVFAKGGSATDLTATRVAAVNLDRPVGGQRFGQRVVDFLKDERFAEVLAVTEMADEASARAAVNARQAGVAVIIPAGFSAAVMEPGGQATLRLIQDPTLTLGPQVVYRLLSQYVDSFSGAKIVLTVAETQLAARGATPEDVTLGAAVDSYMRWALAEEQNVGLTVQAPASGAGQATSATDALSNLMAKTMAGMLIFFAFFTGADGAMSIIREDEGGTLARLFATPVPRAVALGGKYAGVFVVVGVQAVVVMAASSLLFKINWGQPVSVGLVVLALVAVASGLGVFLMSLAQSSRQAGPLMGGVLTGLGMAGGLFTSTIPNMPAAFDMVTLFTPQGWAMRAWKLVLAGGGAVDVLLPIAILLVMGVAFFVLGVWAFGRRFAG